MVVRKNGNPVSGGGATQVSTTSAMSASATQVNGESVVRSAGWVAILAQVVLMTVWQRV